MEYGPEWYCNPGSKEHEAVVAELEAKDKARRRVHWCQASGDVSLSKQCIAIREEHSDEHALETTRKAFEAIWADAYTHGWSDGRADRDPNIAKNPYAKK